MTAMIDLFTPLDPTDSRSGTKPEPLARVRNGKGQSSSTWGLLCTNRVMSIAKQTFQQMLPAVLSPDYLDSHAPYYHAHWFRYKDTKVAFRTNISLEGEAMETRQQLVRAQNRETVRFLAEKAWKTVGPNHGQNEFTIFGRYRQEHVSELRKVACLATNGKDRVSEGGLLRTLVGEKLHIALKRGHSEDEANKKRSPDNMVLKNLVKEYRLDELVYATPMLAEGGEIKYAHGRRTDFDFLRKCRIFCVDLGEHKQILQDLAKNGSFKSRNDLGSGGWTGVWLSDKIHEQRSADLSDSVLDAILKGAEQEPNSFWRSANDCVYEDENKTNRESEVFGLDQAIQRGVDSFMKIVLGQTGGKVGDYPTKPTVAIHSRTVPQALHGDYLVEKGGQVHPAGEDAVAITPLTESGLYLQVCELPDGIMEWTEIGQAEAALNDPKTCRIVFVPLGVMMIMPDNAYHGGQLCATLCPRLDDPDQLTCQCTLDEWGKIMKKMQLRMHMYVGSTKPQSDMFRGPERDLPLQARKLIQQHNGKKTKNDKIPTDPEKYMRPSPLLEGGPDFPGGLLYHLFEGGTVPTPPPPAEAATPAEASTPAEPSTPASQRKKKKRKQREVSQEGPATTPQRTKAAKGAGSAGGWA